MPQRSDKPILLVDIDGVISLFGFDPNERPDGSWHVIEGLAHFLSASTARHLHELDEWFELAWCSGWEERADEHLPHLLGVPAGLPHLSFDRNPGRGHAHWKLAAIEGHVRDRPTAWVDDAFNEACEEWAAARAAPTLLLRTDPAAGLTDDGVEHLIRWAQAQR